MPKENPNEILSDASSATSSARFITSSTRPKNLLKSPVDDYRGINAVAESFFSHMKTEVHYQHHFANHLAARTAVMEYIESWYNRHRPHSHNGGLQPAATLAAHRDRYQKATT
ncbi:integrase core domain-containing protein [Cryobacterium sp. Y82]|uniref:integrase core domain-containing protein n=1 Tax=Cryobacterium sp. Y82 TaxID=2045017 RepID=UPI00351471F7